MMGPPCRTNLDRTAGSFSARVPLPGALAIVVPLRNEEAVLPELLTCLTQLHASLLEPMQAILVDDASTDETSAILARIDAPWVTRLACPKPLGQHRALLAGMARALESVDVCAVATMDADMDPHPQALTLLLPHLAHGDLVVGRRMGRRRTPLRMMVSAVFHVLCRAVKASPIHDHGSMFRVYSREVASRCVELSGTGSCLSGLGLLASTRPVEVGVSASVHPRTSRYTYREIWAVAREMARVLAASRTVRAARHSPHSKPR